VAKATGCNNLMILTWDFEGNETIKGKDIFLPIWKWLLSWHMRLIEQVAFV
jgi:predicted AAA+ superfamily ATPase